MVEAPAGVCEVRMDVQPSTRDRPARRAVAVAAERAVADSCCTAQIHTNGWSRLSNALLQFRPATPGALV